MQNIKNVILQLIKYSIVDEQIQDVLITQLNQEQDNKLDLALLAEQLENTVKYNDFPLLTKSIIQDTQALKKTQERFEQQMQLIKQSINQIDYQCLNKANKMDIEIQSKNILKLQKELEEYNYKIGEITEQQEFISSQLEHQIAEEFSKQLETIQNNISQTVLKSLDNQLQINFAKYDKFVQGFEKIQSVLDTKADQSQYVEIMQTKVNLQQYQSLKNKFQDIQGNFRYLIEAILDYFEASNSETESINMKKSDMIKSINMIKTILYRVAPNDHVKQAPIKFNVKLKPTIFKTISYQRRIKTEIQE